MANCTINEKLQYILETKDLIKAALETQDIEVLESDTFRKYAEYITEIRKVSSVNGKVGDVTITAEELGALTEIPSEYITETELNDKGYLTSIPDDYALKTDIPTNVSELNNDANYITLNEVPKTDLSNYYTKEEVDGKIPDVSDFITSIPSEYITETELNDKGYLTEIPSEYITESELNDKGYLTEIPSEYITETELNDKGYLTSIPDTYITEDELTTALSDKVSQTALNEAIEGIDVGVKTINNTKGDVNIKTINGESIIGEGDIEIKGGGGVVTETDPIFTEWKNADDVAIGRGVSTDATYTTNINNVIKGDSDKYAYIKDNNGVYTKILDLINNGGGSSEGGSVKVVEMTQSEYDALQIKEEGVIYVITDAAEIAIPTKLSELENDKGYITEIPSEYVTDTELNTSLSPLIINVTQGVNSVEVEKYNKAKNTIYYKTINGESIIGEGNIEIEGGGGSGTINIKELTQAEYNALTSYDDDTFYVITDADKQYVIQSDLSNYYTKEEGDEHYDYDKRYWNSFQYTNDADNWISLRNGTSLIGGSVIYFKTINGEKTVGRGDISFKTINGESLIGSGDIQIKGGSADLSNYYTKSEIDSLIGNVSSKITEINNLI